MYEASTTAFPAFVPVYTVKPRSSVVGKRLKMWYRHANNACHNGFTLPTNWLERPSMLMYQAQLDKFFNQAGFRG